MLGLRSRGRNPRRSRVSVPKQDSGYPSKTTLPFGRMVGATGIEPVTPTMSIVVDANAKVELIEICS